jgi:hypothetical protein
MAGIMYQQEEGKELSHLHGTRKKEVPLAMDHGYNDPGVQVTRIPLDYMS